MSPSKASATPVRGLLTERNFPTKVAAAAEADWYAFVLEELNGLGTMLRFQDDKTGARAGQIKDRIRAVVDTLSWDPAVALKQTWAFVEDRLHEFDDAWGPHLVLRALEPDPKRVQDWLVRLQPESRAIIENSPST